MSEEKPEYLTEAEITPSINSVNGVCGIYFLTFERKIVYVGQSINIGARLRQHVKESKKIFDGFSFIKCDESELYWVEAKYINKFLPVYNKAIPKEDMFFWNLWCVDPELHEFGLEVVKKWMKLSNLSIDERYKRHELDGFKVFAKWWKLNHKGLVTYKHCLDGDVVKWFDLGKPEE